MIYDVHMSNYSYLGAQLQCFLNAVFIKLISSVALDLPFPHSYFPALHSKSCLHPGYITLDISPTQINCICFYKAYDFNKKIALLCHAVLCCYSWLGAEQNSHLLSITISTRHLFIFSASLAHTMTRLFLKCTFVTCASVWHWMMELWTVIVVNYRPCKT